MLSVIIELLQLDLRFEPVLTLIFLEYALNTLARTRVGYFEPPVNEWNAPTGGSKDRALGKIRVSLQNRCSVFRPLAFLDSECDENLLSVFIALHGRSDSCFVQ